jgi:outer membrane protein OmpA-like peptidoglycan-associated protein
MKNYILLPFLFIFFNCTAQENDSVLNIFFSSNSAQLNNTSKKDLKNLLETAKSGELIIDKIIGYCDTIGKTSSNVKLAQKRIDSVELILQESDVKILAEIPTGESYPSDAKNINDHAFWRRVEVYYKISNKTNSLVKSSQTNQFNSIKIDPLHSGDFKPIVLKINFMPGMDILLENSHEEIDNLYEFLSENKNVFAFIRGHVCCGDDYPLSTARAYTVYSILLQKGISPSRLKYQGFSNTKPAISPEVIEEHRIRNRRVDVVFSIIP